MVVCLKEFVVKYKVLFECAPKNGCSGFNRLGAELSSIKALGKNYHLQNEPLHSDDVLLAMRRNSAIFICCAAGVMKDC